MTLYLLGPFTSGPFVCCNFVHYLFRKVFCNIVIQKFQNYSPWTRCLALYMSLFQNNYWCKNYYIFLIKYLRMKYKILPKASILCNKIICFFSLWFSFRRLFFVCFFSNVLMQTPEAVYLLKVRNKDTTGIIENCLN